MSPAWSAGACVRANKSCDDAGLVEDVFVVAFIGKCDGFVRGGVVFLHADRVLLLVGSRGSVGYLYCEIFCSRADGLRYLSSVKKKAALCVL